MARQEKKHTLEVVLLQKSNKCKSEPKQIERTWRQCLVRWALLRKRERERDVGTVFLSDISSGYMCSGSWWSASALQAQLEKRRAASYSWQEQGLMWKYILMMERFLPSRSKRSFAYPWVRVAVCYSSVYEHKCLLLYVHGLSIALCMFCFTIQCKSVGFWWLCFPLFFLWYKT